MLETERQSLRDVARRLRVIGGRGDERVRRVLTTAADRIDGIVERR